MALTKERAEVLSKFLNADQERAEKLITLDPSEAVTQINSHGYDFTVDELKEYGDALRTVAAKKDELGADELDEVAGGIIPAIIAGGASIVVAIIGAKKW